MTTTTDLTLGAMLAQLPAPLTDQVPGAWVEHGRRKLSWGPLPGGELFRNRFTMLWVDVAERTVAWSGEADVWPTRRRDDSLPREGFTDAGRKAFARHLLPTIHRIGFDQLWRAALAHRSATSGDFTRQAERHRAIARWWDAKGELAHLNAQGLVRFEPDTNADDRGRGTAVLTSRDHARTERQPVMARALVDGEHVGWLTDHADLIPLSLDLERTAQ